MSVTYPVETENEDGWTDWVRPQVGYRLQCCDCGLVHEFEFDIERVDGEDVPIFRARRLNRNTGQVRRWRMLR